MLKNTVLLFLYKGKKMERKMIKAFTRFRLRQNWYKKVKLPEPCFSILENTWHFHPTNCVSDNFKMKEESLMVSVVIPAYNAELTLPPLLYDLMHQKTSYSYEVVIVDDGSTDGTSKILERFHKQNHDKIQVFHQKNAGGCAARNAGIDQSRGRYIAFIDSDDRISQDYLERIVSAAEEHNADIVKCRFEAIREGYIAFDGIADGYLWGGVYHRRLFQRIRFPVGFWYNDMINHVLLYRISKKTVNVENILYKYILSSYQGSSKHWYKGLPQSLDQLYQIIGLQKDYHLLGFSDDEYLFRQTLHECGSIMLRRIKGLDESVKI